ncbi:hypothetical protein [Microtetraspora malaysiensis]|uniref:Uncharacterized protein n=1 Tax=Microtetraspora malaysiensis TaxID=161358 RepID=A0ABW6SKP7_9ACTN
MAVEPQPCPPPGGGTDPDPCAARTTPTATTGLCLADGTPIAVVVTRDCNGVVSEDGWINLPTGAWSAGPPPAGTVACGDSRSIQVSGTFCDLDDDGEVLGLVLIEYAYAADGSIDAVRLVDAVTGDTYTPQGQISTCPAGVEQPEQDVVVLCDVDPDTGAVTTFARDFRRDENGAIVGFSDYDIDGTPYTVTGTVGRCVEDCQDCQTVVLCDTDANPPATIAGTASSGTLPNGVAWTSKGPSPLPPNQQSDGAAWWGSASFPNPGIPTNLWTFDRPVTVEFSVVMVWSTGTGAGEHTVQLPAGAVPISLPPGYTYDPTTSILRGDATLTGCATLSTPTREASARFRVTGVTSLALKYLGTRSLVTECARLGNWAFGALDISLGGSFLRTMCRDCGGTTTVTDTLLDGVTPYALAGSAGVCHPPEAEPCASTVEILRLCDLNPNVEPGEDGKRCAVPFLRHLVHDCTGALAETRDTRMDGVTPYTPVKVVDCGTGGVPALVEVPWQVVDVAPDPDSPAGRGFIFSLSPVDDPGLVGKIRVTTTTVANTTCPGTPPDLMFANPCTYRYEPDAVLREHATYVRVDLLDFDRFEPVTGLVPRPNRLGGTAYWSGTTVLPTVNDQTGELYYDGPPDAWQFHVGNTGGGRSCTSLSFAAVSLRPEGCCGCDSSPEPQPCRDSSTVLLCDLDPECQAGIQPTATDEPNPASFNNWKPGAVPTWCHVDTPGQGTPVWAGGSAVLGPDPKCTTASGGDTHRVIGVHLAAGSPSLTGTVNVTVSLRVRNDGPNPGYRGDGIFGLWDASAGPSRITYVAVPSSAPVGAVYTLTLSAAVPAAALAAGDIVAILDLETYHGAGEKAWTVDQFTWSAEVPAVECEAQFLRTLVTDCETGAVISATDMTLDGQPYTVTGEVGQCAAVGGGECCQQPPPEIRVDVETQLLCIRDEATGDVLDQVVVERVYDNQTGELTEQRLTDPTTGDPVDLPAGAVIAACPTPDRISRSVCVAASGRAEFRTNPANRAAGVDADWRWSTDPAGPWYPTYDVAPNAAWTVADTDTAASAHWVSPHQDRTVCSSTPGVPNVPAVWYTRAAWNLPSDVDPDTIRIAASILNADNGVTRWRLNDGSWQQVGGATHAGPAITFPATAVPGGRAGQNEIIVELVEQSPGATCPSPNQSGMILHVVATFDHDRLAWTQIIDSDGSVYYLDEDGQRQDDLPDGYRVVPCAGGGGECCPTEPQRDHELVQLCDIADDGTSTPFLRHLTYTGGAETPDVVDTGLDGTTPYTVTGEVGQCLPPGMVQCGLDVDDPVSGVSGQITSGTDVDPFAVFQDNLPRAVNQVSYGLAASLAGASTVIPPWTQDTNCASPTQGSAWQAVRLPPVPRPRCDDGTAVVTVTFTLRNDGPANARAGWVAARLVSVSSGVQTVYDVRTGGSAPGVGITRTITATATVPAAILAAGELYWDIRIEVRQAGCKSWTVSDVSAEYTYGVDGCTSPPQLAQLVKLCEPITVAPAGPQPDHELVQLCDIADDGTSTPFLRHLTYIGGSQVPDVVDTGLDGITPYTPEGEIGACTAADEPATDVELLPMCVIDNASGNVLQRILAEVRYDTATGKRTSVNYVDPNGWGPVALPGGTHIDVCPDDATQPADDRPVTVLERCRCDDTTGDGLADTRYVELYAVDGDGTVTPIGTYTQDLAQPYTPVSPVDCDAGATPTQQIVGVRARRVELAPGESWSAGAWPLLQSVTAVAYGGGTITDEAGTTGLREGETATWSVVHEYEAFLSGPLTVACATGTVVVNYTIGVTA